MPPTECLRPLPQEEAWPPPPTASGACPAASLQPVSAPSPGAGKPFPFPQGQANGAAPGGQRCDKGLSWPLAVPQLSLHGRCQPQGLSCAVGVGPARSPHHWTAFLRSPIGPPRAIRAPCRGWRWRHCAHTQARPCQQQVQRVQALSGQHAGSSPSTRHWCEHRPRARRTHFSSDAASCL